MKAFLIPKEGVKVPIPGPKKASLPAAGAEVELTPYWYRRLADGDVAERQPAAAVAEAPAVASEQAAAAAAPTTAEPAPAVAPVAPPKSPKGSTRVEQ
jgi:hypothetical protein